MNDFFKRKESVSVDLPVHGDYKLDDFSNDLTACGITDIDGFRERHEALFNNLIIDSDKENPVATIASKIEKNFTKRELAFLLSKDMLQAAYNKSLKDLKKE